MNYNDYFKYKRRIIVKIGSSSLQHVSTGHIDLIKVEKLVRELTDLRNQGLDVCLVSSGSIPVGATVLGLNKIPTGISERQACAAIGQGRLMMMYQRLFAEYNQTAAQVLMTKNAVFTDQSRDNVKNTFNELFQMGVIPVVNENDTTSTYEMRFGDNDTLSAIVTSLVDADLLILLSDIDGLYTDNPRSNPDAVLIEYVDHIDDKIMDMAKGTPGSRVGTGGMSTKLTAAKIAVKSGADMVIANGADVGVIHQIMAGSFRGTTFRAHEEATFDLKAFIESTVNPLEREAEEQS